MNPLIAAIFAALFVEHANGAQIAQITSDWVQGKSPTEAEQVTLFQTAMATHAAASPGAVSSVTHQT